MPSSSKPITTTDLRAFLFQEMKDLKSGKSTPKQAVAISKLATNIINSAALEIAATRVISNNGQKTEEIKPLSLAAGDET